MAQEIRPQAVPLRPVLFGLPCFRVLGVKSLTARRLGLEDGSALLAAKLKRNQLMRVVGGGQGEGTGMDQKSARRSARESCCCLRGLALFPSAAPERAHISFII